MTDEENDELSEITAVVESFHKSSALLGDADRDNWRRTIMENYVEIVALLYSADDFKGILGRTEQQPRQVSYTNSEFYIYCQSNINTI